MPFLTVGLLFSMTEKNRLRNQALLRCILLPVIFLTVALLGGLRIGAEDHRFIFVAPPLVTLLFAVLLLGLFVRGAMLKIHAWFSENYSPLVNFSHALTLITLFFASALAFNSVLPERGLFFWLFSFFFLWTLANNFFSVFEPKRFLISLIVLFGVAFILKHTIVAALNAPQESYWKELAQKIFEGVTFGAFNAPAYAPATGYISFFALLLFMFGLFLLPNETIEDEIKQIAETSDKLIEAKSDEAIDVIEDEDELTEISK